LLGALGGRTEEPINEVSAPAVAEERGITVYEMKSTQAQDFTDLVRVSAVCGETRTTVVGTTLGRRDRPHLLEAWGQRFNLQIEPCLTLFRYKDVPGIIGRIGTIFGEHGINIGSAAVGHSPKNGEREYAVMALTTDSAVPQSLIDEILGSWDVFVEGRTVSL
jgi:D-3-phosphoglycerate dehydrogenase